MDTPYAVLGLPRGASEEEIRRAYRERVIETHPDPGEVIISRINPRIPRATVVPELGRPLLCSSEFEVIKPKEAVSPYLLCFFLLSPSVQVQIQSLTAGTSASHSRIKPGRILDVLVPDVASARTLVGDELLPSYESACKKMTDALVTIETIRSSAQI